MKNYYTNEKNIQILISLLKQHGVKDIIASPGATNINFVASVQDDDFFNVYSCVDERSAAYMAVGIASETNMPVVLSCTGATASRNYVPGLTEAYYRNLPIIAITAAQHPGRIGQNIPQALDRSVQMKDLVKYSVQLSPVHTAQDAKACNLFVNEAILESKRHNCGPVHINMQTSFDGNLSSFELEEQRKIERIECGNELPKLGNKDVAIVVGAHKRMTCELQDAIDEFCEKYNGVVICDHTSSYSGKYKIQANIITNQEALEDYRKIGLVIDMGDISGAYFKLNPLAVWRVNPDGEIRDTYGTLRYVFEMQELEFFKKYNNLISKKNKTNYYEKWKSKLQELQEKANKIDFPFSNIWTAQHTISKLKDGDRVHLGILNTLRSWNFFDTKKDVFFQANTGGFGIDGITSTAFGQSLATDNKVYCILGDLAFFYDMNSICNRDIKNNLRIMVINNGCGTEFHNYTHTAAKTAKAYGKSFDFMAADGHNGNKSKTLLKHYSQDLGFEYLSAENKEEFLKNIEVFMKDNSKPILFEVFTSDKDESEALRLMNNLELNAKVGVKKVAMKILGNKGKNTIKKMLGR